MTTTRRVDGERSNGRDSEAGATLVEFAFVAPLLFLLLFGVVEVARLVADYTAVWTAAREGARYATTVGPSTVTPGSPRYADCTGIRSAARAKSVTMSLPDSSVHVIYEDAAGTPVADCDAATVLPPPGTGLPNGATVRVTVDGTFNAVVPFSSVFLDGLPLGSTQTRSVFKGVVGSA